MVRRVEAGDSAVWDRKRMNERRRQPSPALGGLRVVCSANVLVEQHGDQQSERVLDEDVVRLPTCS
jgi:hypothetical protein